ncbi:hypothetical protein [Desulfosporosinus sp. SB140]
MDHSKILFSNLTNDQIRDLTELENKFNSSTLNGQETILIAYESPKK